MTGYLGILIPLLVTFLSQRENHSTWFVGYVVLVNMISMVQTLVGVTQGADLFDTAPYREPVSTIGLADVLG